MAQMNVNDLLNASFKTWMSLPQMQKEFDEMDYFERLPYLEEWPSEERQLSRLHQIFNEGKMGRAQEKRYRELMNVVEQNRSIIKALQSA